MLEAFRRWKENRIMRRAMRSGETIKGAEEIRSRLIEMSQGTHDIKTVVTPRAGNPMFDALPDVLEALAPDAKATVIFAIPKDYKPDDKTQETFNRIQSITQRRNGPEIDAIAEDDADLAQLDLQLQGEPNFNNLAAFIRDPKNPDLYWYRKIGIERGSMKPKGMEKEIPYVDLKKYDMGDLERNPCPSYLLNNAIRNMRIMEEDFVAKHDNPEIKAMQAVVGVARYTGQEELTVDGVLRLVAVKFSRMQTNPRSTDS